LRRPDPDDPDRVIFESPAVSAGQFRCPVGHPRFEDTGPTRQYCFVFPRNACWIEQQDHRPFVADSTVVPLYNRGQPYRRGVIDDGGDVTDWFGVAPEVLREMLAAIDPAAGDRAEVLFTRPFAPASRTTFLLQRRVFRHLTATEGVPDAMFVEEAVLTALADVLARSHAPRDRRETPQFDVAQRAREQLNRTFRSADGLLDVARAVGVSPFHLCRVFRHETGHTLHAYRTELRLRWSLGALVDGGDILSVALAAGFAHHSHFTGAFRRAFGLTPSEYRDSRR
jgi:AraC-like DNA-binding protein